jgi:hypothetical protein
MQRVMLVACVVLASACVLHRDGQRLSLHESLALELELGAIGWVLDDTSQLHFRLRNVGQKPVEICQIESGVTVVATIDGGGVLPLTGYGAVLDAGCYRRGTLAPGAERAFDERVAIRADARSVWGLIRVATPNGDDTAAIRSKAIPVTTK